MNAKGLMDVARTCWANQVANIVNDLPAEAWLYPATGQKRGRNASPTST